MPKFYEKRVRKVHDDPEYWACQQYRRCDCPHCLEGGHWSQTAGHPKRERVDPAYRDKIRIEALRKKGRR